MLNMSINSKQQANGFTPFEKSRPKVAEVYPVVNEFYYGATDHRSGLSQTGFTLIELLLAMTFFSFMLIFIAAGFIQINRIYQSAVVTKNAQNTTRAIFEQMSRDAKDGSTLFVQAPDASGSFCFGVGDVLYYFDKTARTLHRALVHDCSLVRTNGALVHEQSLKVYGVQVNQVKAVAGGANRSLQITITLGVANESLIDLASTRCQVTGVTAAIHLCSVIQMSTAITTRGEES